HRKEFKMKVSRNVAVLTVLALSSVAHAASTPEQACQKGRYGAAAKYSQCGQKATGKLVAGGDIGKHQTTMAKCRTKYAATWTKLQAKAAGSGATCDAPRFIDNGNGTITDNLTALQW